MLKEAEWVRKDYWVSHFDSKGFGNLLICRIPPLSLVSIKVKTLPRSVQTGFFMVRDKVVSVSICHLIAVDKNR